MADVNDPNYWARKRDEASKALKQSTTERERQRAAEQIREAEQQIELAKRRRAPLPSDLPAKKKDEDEPPLIVEKD
jgi:hypothetical protein